MRWWWSSLVVVTTAACSLPWDDLDPRVGRGGGPGTGGSGASSLGGNLAGAGGTTGGAGGLEPDPCAACPTSCGDTFTESFADPPSGWTFNGDAAHDATAETAVLTPPQTNRAGTVFRNDPIAVDAFTATFEIMISDTPMNTGGGVSYGAGDGIAFVLQTDGPTALGDSGGGLGVSPMNGFAIEFDTQPDSSVCLDPHFEHVALSDLATTCDVNGDDAIPTTIAASDVLSGNLAEGGWRSASVHFDRGQISVTLDGASVLGPVTLPGFVAGTPHHFGFGAGTGDAVNRHEVRNLTVTFPTPRCL